jgi:endonuclease/exonuclease/phosphatase family metal-dependent hydrolase
MNRKRWLLAIGGGIGIIGGALAWMSGRTPTGADCLPSTGEAREIEPGDTISVVSWNIHYGGGPTMEVGRGQSRDEVIDYLESIAAHIRSWNPDIVALQEVDRGAIRSYGIDQLTWLQEATGMPYSAWTTTWDARWVPSPGMDPKTQIGQVHSGQAVLSRFPLSQAVRHDLPQPPEQGWFYNRFYLHRALLEVSAQLGPTRSARIVNAHLEAFHPGNRQNQATHTARLLDGGAPHTLFLGDMNCTPPEAEQRKAFADEPHTDMSEDETIGLLRDIPGISEVVPASIYSAQEAPWWTFPAHAPNRRLDYIFHGEGLTLATARVPRMEHPPSDHLPVLATFRVE